MGEQFPAGIGEHGVGEILAPGPAADRDQNLQTGVAGFEGIELPEIHGVGCEVGQPGLPFLYVHEGVVDMGELFDHNGFRVRDKTTEAAYISDHYGLWFGWAGGRQCSGCAGNNEERRDGGA